MRPTHAFMLSIITPERSGRGAPSSPLLLALNLRMGLPCPPLSQFNRFYSIPAVGCHDQREVPGEDSFQTDENADERHGGMWEPVLAA